MRRVVIILGFLLVAVWTARWWSGGTTLIERVRPALPEFSRQIEQVSSSPKVESPRGPRETSTAPTRKPASATNGVTTSATLTDSENIRKYLRSTLAQIENLGRDTVPMGRITLDQTNDMGFRSTIEETQSGETVARTYDVSGSILGEKWKKVGGEEVVRTYRSDGQVEGVYYQRRDGTSTSVSWSREGRLHSKKDDLGNGELIYTLYDNSGYESQVWRKTKDGRSLRLDN